MPFEFPTHTALGAHAALHAGHVLLFDLDAKFDVLRMHSILDSRLVAALRRAGAPGSPCDLSARAEPMVRTALARLHVARCHGSFGFLAALKAARPTLRALAASPDASRPVALMVDNAAAYWYVDRAARGAAAAAGGGGGAGGGGSGGPGGTVAALAALVLALLPDEQRQQQGQQHISTSPLLLAAPDVTKEGAPLSAMRVAVATAAELRSLAQEFRLPVLATKHTVLPQGACVGQGL